ncbi:hypothetical protein EZS27_007963 [termite gut metagenome]|uniref:L-2-amino-thiazoline-4-carboxylic acid hydrolase n=1 Tax=termite gut metagenome TaxID=433724 RepID=A0A5J4SGQ0_9ZZZZ
MKKQRREFIKAMGLTSVGLLSGGAFLRAGTPQEKPTTIYEVRKACRQFAMLYFNFCKVLVDALGETEAFPLVQKAIFKLSLDRSDKIRAKVLAEGIEPVPENFNAVNDLPYVAWHEWEPSMGGVRCPYAEVWLDYFETHPWFKRFASLYCDVIDTTNMENFTRTTSHRITQNLLWGDAVCEREYFESEQVKQGQFTYGKR